MLVERLTFRAKYGHGDELVELFKEVDALLPGRDGAVRIYTDATGPMFTIQVEQEFNDWAAYSTFMAADQALYGTPEFAAWFARMQAVTEHGDRQLLNVTTL